MDTVGVGLSSRPVRLVEAHSHYPVLCAEPYPKPRSDQLGSWPSSHDKVLFV